MPITIDLSQRPSARKAIDLSQRPSVAGKTRTPIPPVVTEGVENPTLEEQRTGFGERFKAQAAKGFGELTAPARAVVEKTTEIAGEGLKRIQESVGVGIEEVKGARVRAKIINEAMNRNDAAYLNNEISIEEYQNRKKQFEELKREGGSQIGAITKAAAGSVRGGVEFATSPVAGVASAVAEPIITKGIESMSEENQNKVMQAIQYLEEAGNEHPILRDLGMTALEIVGLGAAQKVTKGVVKEVAEQVPKVASRTGEIFGEISEQALAPIRRAGEAIEGSGLRTVAQRKESFVDDLIRPRETTKVLEEQVRRGEVVGPFQRTATQLSPQQKAIKDEVLKIPELKPNMTLQQSFNVISDANIQKAKSLETAIKENDFIFPKKELTSRLDDAKARLAESPTLTGDAQKTAEKIMNKFKQFVDERGAKGSGLLQARKDLDQWIRGQKPKAFDAQTENAFDLALREIRKTANNFLDEKSTSVSVKQSLREQSLLFNALDNIIPKAAREADTILGRIVQKAEKALGPNKLIKAIAASSGAIIAPSAILGLTGTILGAKGIKALVTSPQLRIQLGRLLKLLSTKKGASIGLSAAALAALQDDIKALLGNQGES